MPFVPGENVGPYRIIEQLGQGGMATVYKAYHPALDRYVAIKALHPAFMEDPNFLVRFQREARLVAKLDHPNIIPIYDAADHIGQPYLVMKFIQGETLKVKLARGVLSNPEKLRIVEAIGSALGYAHQQGILHRDIKPSNVIIADDGQVYLADFGLARIASAGESTISSDLFIGTPQYISPEQAQGKRDLDEGTDIYSFGVVLYEMMVGKVPFSADTPYAIIHDHIFTPLPMPRSINPQVSEAMELVLLKALAKNRADRYADVGSLVAAFKAAFSTLEVGWAAQGRSSSAAVKTPAEKALPLTDEAKKPPAQADIAASTTIAVPSSVIGAETGEAQARAVKPKSGLNRWVLATGLVFLACFCILVLIGISRRSEQLGAKSVQSQVNAISTAQQKVELSPDDPGAHLDLALALDESGEKEKSKQELDFALELSGDNLEFYREAGNILLARANWLAASHVFLRLAEKYPQPIPIELAASMRHAWYKGSQLDAFPEFAPFDSLLRVDPLMANVARARYELYHGAPVRAKAALTPVIEKSPDFMEARLVQIEMLIQSQSREEAQRLLDAISSRRDLPPWMVEELQRLSNEINQP